MCDTQQSVVCGKKNNSTGSVLQHKNTTGEHDHKNDTHAMCDTQQSVVCGKKTVQHFIQLKQLLLTVSSGWTDVEGNLPSNLYSTFFFSFTKTGLQKEMFFHYPTRKPAIS